MADPFAVIFLPGGTAAAILLLAGPGLHLFQGAHVCGTCASTRRRRFRFANPALLVMAAGFGVSSFSAFAQLVGSGRTELGWWLDGRWIPLLLPSVGVAAATWLFIKWGRRANRLRDAGPWRDLHESDVRDWILFRRGEPSSLDDPHALR